MEKKIVGDIIFIVVLFALTALLCLLAYAERESVVRVAACMFFVGSGATIIAAGVGVVLCKLGITHGC